MFKNECCVCKGKEGPLDHTKDYFYMRVKGKTYEFHRKCLEDKLGCDLETWSVTVIL